MVIDYSALRDDIRAVTSALQARADPDEDDLSRFLQAFDAGSPAVYKLFQLLLAGSVGTKSRLRLTEDDKALIDSIRTRLKGLTDAAGN